MCILKPEIRCCNAEQARKAMAPVLAMWSLALQTGKKGIVGDFEGLKFSGELGTTVATWLTKGWTGEISEKRADASQPGAEWGCGSGSSHWH